MINSHNEHYASDHVSFVCRDIVEDELPDGDMCLIRQVIQHLSNDDILHVLGKLKKYKYSIITEHVTPKGKAKAFNVDIRTGHNNRICLLSGVYLDEPPFNMKAEVILRVPYNDNGLSELVTYLVKG